MRRGVAILVVLLAAACSDRSSPTAPTTPAPTSTGTPIGTTPDALRGTVTDDHGLPLKDATVEWMGVAELWGDRGHGVTTNQDGQYRIGITSLPPGGRAVARASKAGYDQQSKFVQISGDTPLDFAIAQFSANGSVKWVSATRAKPLCPEIASQVGKTFPLWLILKSEGTSVTVTLSRDEPPGADLLASGSRVFTGSRSGDRIAATYQDAGAAFGCSTDATVTAYGSVGELEATVSGGQISGQYTQTYGAGDAKVAFVFQFHARL